MTDQRLAMIWPSVIEAIESSLPYYDRVNQVISLGLAEEMRREAVKSLRDIVKDGPFLDVGIGPGNMSLSLLETVKGVREIVGVDYSTLQLATAKKRLETMGFGGIHNVRAVFEYLPLKDEVFRCVCSGFALRDAVDKASSIRELRRVSRNGGRIILVDMGKPDNYLTRALMTLYITLLMPFVAKLIIRRRIRGNPWRKLAATYKTLSLNQEMLTIVKRIFGINATRLTTRLFGGLVIIWAEKN